MSVKPYIYLPQKSQIVVLRTLEIIELNETAKDIVERYLAGLQALDITEELASKYEINSADVLGDVEDTIKALRLRDINPQPMVNLEKSWHLKTPIVHIIQNCNSPCRMCDCWKTKNRVNHPAQLLNEYFKKIKEFGAETVMISGGEPLLHPELPTILRDLKNLGIGIMLNSNGTKLHLHSWLHDLKIEELIISMDGGDPATYREFRGIDAFESVWRNIARFKAVSPETQIGLRMTLNRKNFDSLQPIIEKAKSYGIASIGFSPADISSSSFSRIDLDQARVLKMSDLLLPSVGEIDKFLSDFLPGSSYYELLENEGQTGFLSWNARQFKRCLEFYRDIILNKTRTFSPDPCLFPTISMVVDYNGDLRSCFYSPAFGNLHDLQNAHWPFESRVSKLKKAGACATCRGKVFCDEATFS